MKKVLGIGNALVDVLVQVESELILNELQLPKGSMQLINTERYLKIQKRLESLNKQLTTGGSACICHQHRYHLGAEHHQTLQGIQQGALLASPPIKAWI